MHKSLKYEIWSSTDPGNKRLDKAFKESQGRGPIYLFFSVNASGHFCGMAEMLTPVCYWLNRGNQMINIVSFRWTTPVAVQCGHRTNGRAFSKFGGSSSGIFPTSTYGISNSSMSTFARLDTLLISLSNTQERKPVTNSRDTQELLPDAGQEMLRIFFTHPARTSLLQDFAFYEVGPLVFSHSITKL